MDNGIKTQLRPAIAPQMASAELAERLNEAKDELKGAIESADLERMTALRAEIKALPEQINLTEIRELKERLNQIESALQENEETKNLIRELIARRKQELQAELDRIQPFYQRLNEASFQYGFAENDYQLLLMERREKRSRLFSLSETLMEADDES